MSVVNAFTKETPERSFAPSHEAHSSTKMPGLNQEEGPDGTMLHLDLVLSAFQNCKKSISVAFKLPSLY